MKQLFITTVLLIAATNLLAEPGPFDGKTFKGRIAYSSDGNWNDEDDWAASPVSLAIFANSGVKDRLVHYDYNSILPNTVPEWEKKHETSVLGAIERYGYRKEIFYNCRRNLDAAIESIRRAIDESSAESPLYFIIAGPMEVPFRAIEKSKPEKRKFVYVISHSRWNDGFLRNNPFAHTKRNLIPTGIHWVQIQGQNLLATSPFGRPATDQEWLPWHWMRDSRDANVRFLWERMQATTRADCSDAGMSYFLVTGDESADPIKLKKLLDEKIVAPVAAERASVRIEAENFLQLDQFQVEDINDKRSSHALSVKLSGKPGGYIRTPFREPYAASAGQFDISIRFAESGSGRSTFALSVDGVRRGKPWTGSSDDRTWKSHTVPQVNLRAGNEIRIEVTGEPGAAARLDYVQLDRCDAAAKIAPRFVPSGALDDPEALPGQLIVAGGRPGYLKYNGGGPAFLAGPDNPENFFFLGTINPDGTRAGGEQDKLIDHLGETGVNALHVLLFRMRRCNIKDEGDDTNTPFIDSDPAKPLNEAVLNQWNQWLTRLEEKGVIVHIEFYNDATDVERMGWKLDAQGNLHPNEHRFIEGVVNRLKHHRNILWSIEESANKLPKERTPHFKKIGEVIAKADNHHHPIMQSFVVPDDPDKDFPKDGIYPDEYIGDPNVRVVTWLHVVPQGEDVEKAHQEYLKYYKRDAANFIVMKNETFFKPYLQRAPFGRQYMWACAMAGVHSMEAQHYANKPGHTTLLREDSFLGAFMERSDFHLVKPHDELAAGSTKWVLAGQDNTYIGYTYKYSGPMAFKDMKAGTYDLTWLDTATGKVVVQKGVAFAPGGAGWNKPESIGDEVALSVKRR